MLYHYHYLSENAEFRRLLHTKAAGYLRKIFPFLKVMPRRFFSALVRCGISYKRIFGVKLYSQQDFIFQYNNSIVLLCLKNDDAFHPLVYMSSLIQKSLVRNIESHCWSRLVNDRFLPSFNTGTTPW